MAKNVLKALSEGTNAAGGFTVPDPLSARLQEFVQANSVAINDMDQSVVLTSDNVRIPRLTSGSTVATGVGESSAIAGADLGFGQITLSAKKVAALLTASTELVEDSNQNVIAVVQSQFAKDIQLEVDRQILAGTGTDEFTGLTGGVAAANTFSAGTLAYEDFADGNDKVLAGNHPLPGVAYLNPANMTALVKLTDSSARPIFNNETWGSPLLNTGVVGTALGSEIKTTTQLTTSMIVGGVRGRMGYYGVRRAMNFNRFYQIASDDWVFQANLRPAFAVKYDTSFYLMTDIA
jgi:HK97 family phage major capsid protein